MRCASTQCSQRQNGELYEKLENGGVDNSARFNSVGSGYVHKSAVCNDTAHYPVCGGGVVFGGRFRLRRPYRHNLRNIAGNVFRLVIYRIRGGDGGVYAGNTEFQKPPPIRKRFYKASRMDFFGGVCTGRNIVPCGGNNPVYCRQFGSGCGCFGAFVRSS